MGETPLRHEFIHYGQVRVTLYDELHLTYSKVIHLEPPWYGRAGVDIVGDLFPWRDRHLLHVRMRPLTDEVASGEIDSILERAATLRRSGPEGPASLPPRRSALPEADEPTPEPPTDPR